MKIKNSILTFIAVCGLTVFITGCGDDDNDDNDSGSNAPGSLSGQTYDLAAPSGTGMVRFTSDSAVELTEPGTTTVETGTFTGALSGNTQTVSLNFPAGKTGTLTLNFDTSSTIGHFTLAITDGATHNGIFSVSGGSTNGGSTGSTTGATTGSTTGETTGNTTGTTSGNVGGPFGKPMVVTVNSGVSQGTTYTILFTGQTDSGRFQIEGEARSGIYTFGGSGGTAILEMRYEQSSNGASAPDNDYLQIDLPSQSFGGVRKIGATSDFFSGTYTLQ